MRHTLAAVAWPFTAWLGAIQATTSTGNVENMGRIIGIAGVLGSLTVLIYRLGVWRQEMENTRNNLGAEVKATAGEGDFAVASSHSSSQPRLSIAEHTAA